MKKNCLHLLLILVLTACGQGSKKQDDQQDTTIKTEEIDPGSIPGIDKVPITDTISLQANDDMHFDKELFKIKSNQKIVLRLKNIGSQKGMPMSHNVVILNKGTDITTFADEARNAKSENYIPSKLASSIIAHTKQVSAGESDETTFTISKAGVYTFICSFPGHWGSMQGQIVVE
ncbi:plastocyanin/azurin family copper-binding protein [Mucilaginibacter sp. FT3.2]|uniref:plastocyanin/azurin family copper-binding protein n=1 Tax=Mucilaginibacter sp. FT3.2 TaxID=2723090 RepID=UPI00161F208A|nr:plastocyanin/azurin family copper-binding protein [Mucilaginibacter sp. FT3.2]MBB6233490.1 azurin [Mucilaginibacter sp. FT3.2]